MKYNYLFATDMDYTLLMPGEDIPEENLRSAKKLSEYGVALTLSTGRSPFLTGKFSDALGIDVPLITGNGSTLWDPVSRKHIHSMDFPEEILVRYSRLFLEKNIDATAYSTEGIFFYPASSRWGFCEDYNKGLPEELKAPLVDICETDLPPVSKFLLINPPEEIMDEMRSTGLFELVTSGPGLYDVMLKGATKGNALLKLTDTLGIPRGNTFGIGDSENDLSLIADSGHGIAMGNSSEEIKAHAEYITSACTEMGFSKAIEEFVIPLVKASN
ncbi:MAG: HAD family hydrolase [Clostridiales bacterium]|nr:HAD family hydrolase [Clostridiales bacterium]